MALRIVYTWKCDVCGETRGQVVFADEPGIGRDGWRPGDWIQPNLLPPNGALVPEPITDEESANGTVWGWSWFRGCLICPKHAMRMEPRTPGCDQPLMFMPPKEPIPTEAEQAVIAQSLELLDSL